MLYRKIESLIYSHLTSSSDKIMVINGARQVGKSYIIRAIGSRLFSNFIEINFIEDDQGEQIFKSVKTVEEFEFVLTAKFPGKLGDYTDTLILLDEIQHYPQYLTWLKFFRERHRFHFIASGSLLGITLSDTTSIPVGSIMIKEMYPLDFEEFMIASGVGKDLLTRLKECFRNRESLSEAMHKIVMSHFLRYLIVGGMPDAVNAYIETHDAGKVRGVQTSIHDLYKGDATKYENGANKKLLIRRIYDMIPSQLENKKKRVVVKDILNKKGDRFDNYREEFEYLVASGIAIEVNAVTNPKFPLTESLTKNLLKLYLNDVGLMTNALYRLNMKPILDTECSVNLGSVYENVVAQELKAHGNPLFYYDKKNLGEVDFIVDDYWNTSVLPLEVKSGKDYYVHSALNRLLEVPDYKIREGIVFSNEREVKQIENIWYMPVYQVMWVTSENAPDPSLLQL